MSTDTYTLLFVVIGLALTFLFIITVFAVNSAYHNGVRDGYSNTWLPAVKKQIQEEGLTQGEEVAIP